MEKAYNVAIVGATGVVGNEMLRVLEERSFPVKALRLLASERSDGEFVEFRGESVMVEKLTSDSFAGIDIALFAVSAELGRNFCPLATAAGAVCIDTSSAWRFDPMVPLIVPEVNAGEIGRYAGKGIIASPGSSTIQLVVALKPLHDAAKIKRVVVSTFQSVSGSGRQAIDELRFECGELLNGRPGSPKVYPHQIAFNCLPQIDVFLDNGYTREEMSLVDESRKILGDEAVGITATTVLVPVFYGHSGSVNIETTTRLTAAQARQLIASAPGCELVDDPAQFLYPMALDAAGQDLVQVGRIREDESIPNGLNLWLVADNIRKGAATNVVQIAEVLIERFL